jgi:hypothetical protein
MAKDKEQQPEQPQGPVKVRVLVDHGEQLRCNTVIEVDGPTAALLKRDGLVDDDPAAVAACEGGS